MLKRAQISDLPKIVDCHIASFPNNLHSRLGKRFIARTFLPFVNDQDKYLMFIEVNGTCVAFFSALPSGGEFGSASTMIQSAFYEGVLALVVRPWLAVHPEVRKKLPLIWRNVKVKFLKMTGRKPASKSRTVGGVKRRELGLAGMGVHPNHRKGGYAIELIRGVEKLARDLGYEAVQGSVSVENNRANGLYQLLGWSLIRKSEVVYCCRKDIQGIRVPAPSKSSKASASLSHGVLEVEPVLR